MTLATVIVPAHDAETARPDRGMSVPAHPKHGRVAPGGQTRPRTSKVATARRPKLGPVECRRVTPAAMPTVAPMRLTRRGVVATWLVGLLTLGVIAFGLIQGAAPVAPARAGTTVVTVLPGESLWTLAQQVNPAVDPRVTVNAVRSMNGLGATSIVEPGAELMVPVYARGG